MLSHSTLPELGAAVVGPFDVADQLLTTTNEVIQQMTELAAGFWPLRLFEPDIIERDTAPGAFHEDVWQERHLVHCRYLVANRCPTEVPELGPIEPGHVIRTVNGSTTHRQPQVYATPDTPRLLLAANV